MMRIIVEELKRAGFQCTFDKDEHGKILELVIIPTQESQYTESIGTLTKLSWKDCRVVDELIYNLQIMQVIKDG